VPDIDSGPSEGYNESSYGFSVRSRDPDGDQITYTFNWGDGNSSKTDLIKSDEIAKRNHSWSQAGVYNVMVMATDEHGTNSSFSNKSKVKISWLVKVPPGVLLQPVINSIYSNTMVLLEGDDYTGPINITKSNITMSSISTSGYSNIRSCINDSKNYTIGLINSNNVTIEKLYITDGYHGIYINNCTYCKILNSYISIKKCGVQIYNSNNTTIEGNLINKSAWSNSLGGSVGISVVYSDNNTIGCNTIQGLDNENDSVYYIINSSLKEFKVDSAIDGLILKNGCCCNYTNGRLVNCNWCSYENGVVTFNKHSNNETNCSIELNIGGC
jgi:hypothetical protein